MVSLEQDSQASHRSFLLPGTRIEVALGGEELPAWAHQSPFASKRGEKRKEKDLGERSIQKEPGLGFLRDLLGAVNSSQVLGINPPDYLEVNQEEDDGFM